MADLSDSRKSGQSALGVDEKLPPRAPGPTSFPAGLVLQSNGALTGTAAALGSSAFTVAVRDGAGTVSTRALTLDVCSAPISLAIGASVTTYFPNSCGVALPSENGATFRVGVMARRYQTTGSTAALVPGGLLLRTRAAPPVSAAGSDPATGFKPFGRRDEFDSETERLMNATENLHRRLRDDEIRVLGRTPRTRLGAPNAALAWMADQAVPATDRTFFISNPDGGPRIEIGATLRASSDHIHYYQDNSVVGTNDLATPAEIQAVLDYYHSYGKPVIDNVFGGLGPPGSIDHYIGGPRLAADVDGNGAFILLQLSSSHMLDGAAGYVSSCDRLPRTENRNPGFQSCTVSNEGEIMYVLRPSSGFYLGTVVHEAKHISSLAYALFGNRAFNPSWIEEGTAEIAKEMSSRRAANLPDGMEVRYEHVFPGGEITNATYGMYTVQSRARAFLRAAPLNGIIGNPNPNPNSSTYYGASWLFHRYLADRYATAGEAAFFRQMNTTASGTAGIEAATGRTFADLLTEFTIAVSVEGIPQAKQVTLNRFRTYDFANLAEPMGGGTWPYFRAASAFTTSFTPLATYYSSPSFFEFTSNASPFLRVDVFQMDGAPVSPSTDAVVTIVRVR